MKNLLFSGVLIAAVAYVTAAATLYSNQRGYIYFPTSAVNNVEEPKISISNNDVLLKGWVINPNQQKAIIYFGGNSEQISDNIPDFKEIFPNHTVYLINYRGYGESSGTPSAEGFYSDALKIYDTIKQDYQTISVIGRSLGSGTATYLATQLKLNKLVLVTPFDSITNMAKDEHPIFPISLLLKDKFDSLSRANKIASPTLVFIAENDDIVPLHRTENLIKALPQKLTTVKYVQKSNHNNITSNSNYKHDLKSWFIVN